MAHVELYDGYDMGSFQEGELNGSTIVAQTSTQSTYSWSSGRYFLKTTGEGFAFGGGVFGTQLTAGVVTGVELASPEGRMLITGAHADAPTYASSYTLNDTRIAEAVLLAGDDDIHVIDGTGPSSTPNPDHAYLAYGYAGNDLMVGGGALSTFFGGTGNDTLEAGSAVASALSGDEGDDVLLGGSGADTLSGGVGRDVLTGGAGDDVFILTPPGGGLVLSQIDVISDWQVGDRMIFGRAAGLTGNYVEATADTTSEALAFANARIAGGLDDYVAVSVGGSVYVFADSRGDNGGADDAVMLSGRSLADLSAANIVAGRPLTAAIAEPAAPASPSTPLTPSASITISGNLDLAHIGDLATADVTLASGSEIRLSGGGFIVTISGAGFVYDADGDLVAGTVTGFHLVQAVGGVTVLDFNATFPSKTVAFLAQLEAAADATAAFQLLFGTTPQITANQGDEVIHGGLGADVIFGGGGQDSLFGGGGSDVIFTTAPWGKTGTAAAGSGYLRGEDGDDYLVGGAAFDDLHGNMGNDTVIGGLGDDWVVGGKDDDQLFGQGGGDIVYGNLGNDTCVGGAGDDVVRGGQGNDLVFGDSGNDWLSGDRGDDTLTGGEGADIFHTFAEAGIDRVLDFTVIEGDRVQLDPGTVYTLSQVGADVVIDMGGGNQMILVGVQLATLPPDWIFGA